MVSKQFSRGVAVLLASAWLVSPLAIAQTVTKGPQISNPQIEEGSLPKQSKGFGKPGTEFKKGSAQMKEEMGRATVTVSDRCFVTRVDYCYMDGYAPVGTACYCSDGYYVYDGVVY